MPSRTGRTLMTGSAAVATCHLPGHEARHGIVHEPPLTELPHLKQAHPVVIQGNPQLLSGLHYVPHVQMSEVSISG